MRSPARTGAQCDEAPARRLLIGRAMNRTVLSSLVAVTLAVLAAPAHAEDAATAEALPKLSVTISPVHLIFPIVELTGELRLQPKLGAAMIIGAGTADVALSDTDASIYEVGGSVRYYAMGSFRQGLQVGGEVLYLGASHPGDGGGQIDGEGLELGAFVGYKYAARFGLTVEAQGGIAAGVVRASNASASNEDRAVRPLVNLNVGWSF